MMLNPSHKFKLISMSLLILVVLNLSYISVYLLNSPISSTSASQHHSVLNQEPSRSLHKTNKKDDRIAIEFNIMDIYRVDVSCEYITQALGAKISTKYALSSKKSSSQCSLKQPQQQDAPDYKPAVSLNETRSSDFDPFSLDSYNPMGVELGGVYVPRNLQSSCGVDNLQHIVFIVPFSRSRLDNLKLFLLNMHSYLTTVPNQFKYRIVVAEQINTGKSGENFNKGRIYNAAFKYVQETYSDVDCIVLHDADLIPSASGSKLAESGDYRCQLMPWHLTRRIFQIETQKDRVYNQFLTGGILSLNVRHFVDVNGFSNRYFGWGAEDDDFQLRMFSTNLCIMRPNVTLESTSPAPFIMLTHRKTNANNKRFSMLTSALTRQFQDGLTDVKNLVEIKNVTLYPTFTHLAINVLN